MNARELRDRRGIVLDQAAAMVNKAEIEDRDLSQDEQGQYDGLITEADSLEQRAARLEALPQTAGKAPAHLKIRRGDSEERAIAHYVRTGDQGAVRDLMTQVEDRSGRPEIEIRLPSSRELRAVTDSTMNITTAADGGNTVPTGFAGQIAARRSEIRLAERLGVRMVPGTGTTVNFPYENADAQAFAATAETADNHATVYTRDALQFGSKAFTLAKKTKKIELTEELLDDEDANLMAFIADNVGRAIGITHNTLMLTEAAASGTAVKTFASATAIAAGEPEDMVFHDTLSYYLDDGSSPAWVMRPTTLGMIKGLTGDFRQYGEQTLGSGPIKTLLEYPAYWSNAAAAVAASAKSVYFGNWWYMGMREDPALRLIRDPYSVDGITVLKYSFRTVYGVLIAGAIGYGVHPSA